MSKKLYPSLTLEHSLNVKTVRFQAIQFSIRIYFSSVWPIDGTLAGATTAVVGSPGSDGNEGVYCSPQSSSFTGTSPPKCFVSYPGYLGGDLVLCRGAVGIFYSCSQLDGCVWVQVMMCVCVRVRVCKRERERERERERGREREYIFVRACVCIHHKVFM